MAESLFTNRPAITNEAESPEMEQLAYEATAALEAASIGGSTYLARMKDAGELLSKAKKKCKHGKWIPWLNRHNISRTKAFRALKAYAKCFTVKHLDDAISDLAEKGEEVEIAGSDSPLDNGDEFCSRNCRVGIGPSNCKACAKLNKKPGVKQAEPQTPAPEPQAKPTSSEVANAKLLKILGEAVTYRDLAKSAKNLSKKIRKIERSEIYRKATGDRTEPLAEEVLGVSTKIALIAPKQACKACGGSVTASEDSEPCGDCNGKGWLTIGEAKAISERLDF